MRWLCFAVLAVLVLAARSALACTLPDDLRTDIPPNGSQQPTGITVSFAVVDFMDVDDGHQQIELDFFLQTNWTDPRLDGLDGCRFGISEVWFPRVRLLNSDNLRVAYRNARNQVSVGPNGAVEYVQRFTGPVSSYHNLRDFPFDSHVFSVDFAAVSDDLNLIEFRPDNDKTWINTRLNIEGWDVGRVYLEATTRLLPDDRTEAEILSLKIEAKRLPEFYVYRLILLLGLVVGMSWVIFWVPPSQFEFQIGIGATTMLTAIAFIFAISNELPPVGYLTILDRMVIWAILLVFLSIVEALASGRLMLSGATDRALLLDRISRVVFPILLLVGWTVAIYR